MKAKELQAVLSKHGIDHKLIDLEASFEARTELPIEVSRAIRSYRAERLRSEDHVSRNVAAYQAEREAKLRAELSRAQTTQQMEQSPFGHIAFNQAGELVQI